MILKQLSFTSFIPAIIISVSKEVLICNYNRLNMYSNVAPGEMSDFKLKIEFF